MQSPADAFDAHRRELVGLAYRMTGSVADAEDVVQDAFVRFERAAQDVEHPRAWLHRVVTRLCLDLARSAPHRREVYVGPWLPELLVEPTASHADAALEVAGEVSVALLLALERLSPAERAAFILREAFDHGYDEIGALLDRSEPACRQLVRRARQRVREQRPSQAADPQAYEQAIHKLQAAIASGDPGAVEQVLTDDVELVSDGGGKVLAALRPLHGPSHVARFLVGISKKHPITAATRIFSARVGGLPGLVFLEGGRVTSVFAFELAGDRIATLYVLRNPDKLQHVSIPKAGVSPG